MMGAPLPSHAQASLALARQLVREAAIQDLRPDMFLVEVVGAVIAVIQNSRGDEYAQMVARATSRGCLEIIGVIQKGAR